MFPEPMTSGHAGRQEAYRSSQVNQLNPIPKVQSVPLDKLVTSNLIETGMRGIYDLIATITGENKPPIGDS
jgi:hypothetical protein